MKIYITADIEGVTGATHWDETDKKNAEFTEFGEQVTAEVGAACEGALNAVPAPCLRLNKKGSLGVLAGAACRFISVFHRTPPVRDALIMAQYRPGKTRHAWG
jgi:hypothetical protein